jgi:hypothetical protein
MASDLLTAFEGRTYATLAGGERYVAALRLTVKGPVALTALFAGLDVATRLPNHVAAHGPIETLEVADAELPNSFIAALTDSRLLVFGRSITGKPKDLIAEHPLSELTIDVVDHGERVLARTFVFTQADGKVFAGECGINGKARDVADRFAAAANLVV